MRSILLFAALILGGPAMAQPSEEQSILKIHQACSTRTRAAANATLDAPDRPIELDVILRKYETVLRTVHDGCMTENGYKRRTDLSWCTANKFPRLSVTSLFAE